MAIAIDKIVILMLLLLGENVLYAIGFDIKLLQAIIIMMCVIPISYYYKSWKDYYALLYLLVFVVIYSVYQLVFDKGEGTRQMVLTLLGGSFVIMAMPKPSIPLTNGKQQKFWSFVLTAIVCCYVLETGIAIIERVVGHTLFAWKGIDVLVMDGSDDIEYRSIALYGHPLSNSLLVSTAMLFILISSLKSKYKYSLWLLGFFAILCFNSRSNIVGDVLSLLAYILYQMISNRVKSSTKSVLLAVGFMILIVAYLAIFHFGLGGRLLDMGLMDDSSSQVRVDAWDILDYGIGNFLFGHTFEEALRIKAMYGLLALENPWLGFMVRNGLIFLCVYIFLYFMVIKKLLGSYSLFDKFFVTVCFLLLASTQNSFDSNSIFLTYFMLLSVCFNPPVFRKIVRRKYLS